MLFICVNFCKMLIVKKKNFMSQVNSDSIPEINTRFLAVLEYFGYSGYRMEKEETGIKQVQVSHIKSGRNKPSHDVIEKLLIKFPNVNYQWLTNGIGEMLDNTNPKESVLKNNIVSVDKSKQIDMVIQVPEDDYMMVEFEDLETAAGKLGGNDVVELPETKKRLVPKEYANGFYLVVRVYGESMNDQTYRSILNGDEILIKQYFDFIENLPIRNKLFVIVTEDGSVVKQIKKVDKENKKIICHSFNPTWEDYEVHLDEITQIFTVEKKVKSNIFF